jgi:hypothetical protein
MITLKRRENTNEKILYILSGFKSVELLTWNIQILRQ